MNLIAIYNVWGDSIELLEGSIKQIRESVDFVLIVAQEKSNAGEIDPFVIPFCHSLVNKGLVDKVICFEPYGISLLKNETAKRQLGLEFAKEKGFTHFLHLDSDEYYDSNEFAYLKSVLMEGDFFGSIISLHTYYKYPTLRLKRKEKYGVPFIHKLLKNSACGMSFRNNYFLPVDPSRAINSPGVIDVTLNTMHHYSYVRRDIEKKLRNSTARNNINRQDVIKEYHEAKAGTHLQTLFNDVLIEVPNYFNIDIDSFEYEIREKQANI